MQGRERISAGKPQRNDGTHGLIARKPGRFERYGIALKAREPINSQRVGTERPEVDCRTIRTGEPPEVPGHIRVAGLFTLSQAHRRSVFGSGPDGHFPSRGVDKVRRPRRAEKDGDRYTGCNSAPRQSRFSASSPSRCGLDIRRQRIDPALNRLQQSLGGRCLIDCRKQGANSLCSVRGRCDVVSASSQSGCRGAARCASAICGFSGSVATSR